METNGQSKKRSRTTLELQNEEAITGGLELDSDGENSVASDDGELDEFPEIDLGSSDEESFEETDDEGEEDDEPSSPKPNGELVVSSITGRPKRVYPEIEPEYDSDSSTEDVCPHSVALLKSLILGSKAPNRVGNIPSHWYDDMPHVGYDIEGKKVLRPAKGDELDKFLSTVEDPESW